MALIATFAVTAVKTGAATSMKASVAMIPPLPFCLDSLVVGQGNGGSENFISPKRSTSNPISSKFPEEEMWTSQNTFIGSAT